MSSFDPDWYAHQGRDLAWYVTRAREGDQRARERALELIRGSLSAAGLAQSGGVIDARLHGLLLEAVSEHLKPQAKRGAPRKDLDARRLEFALCCELHRRVLEAKAQESIANLAQDVIDDAREYADPEFESDNLIKAYRRWRDMPSDPLGRHLEASDESGKKAAD